MQLLFFGSSTVQGVGDSEGGWVDRVKRQLQADAYAQPLNTRPELGVFNLGVGGDTAIELAQRMPVEIRAREHENYPYAIVISIGTNDAQATGSSDHFLYSVSDYRQNLQKVIAIAQSYTDRVLLVGLLPTDDERQPHGTDFYFQKRVEAFDVVMGEVAADMEVTKVDIFSELVAKNWKDFLLDDGLHPNTQGHKLIARLVLPHVKELLVV